MSPTRIAYVRYIRVASCDDEIEDVTSVVCWLSGVLHVAEQLKYLCTVYVVILI